MGKRYPTVRINAPVLKWLMVGSGWTAQEVSEKTGLKLESIEQWMKHDTDIKLSDLKKIANTIKRPLTVFLLSEPPKERELIDYRRVGGDDTGKFSKKTLNVIRDAKYARSVVAELLDLNSQDARPDIIHRTIKDDPQTVAETEKESLGLNLEKRPKGKSIDAFVRDEYMALKEKIESLNIFVLQAAMDVGEVRGFTLPDGDPKAILINSRAGPRPRLFTLLHEYAHVLLSTDGVCLTNSYNSGAPPGGRNVSVERWCNNFAGAVIMPKEAILYELRNNPEYPPNQMIKHLSRKFCTSKTAVVVRILNLLDEGPHKAEYLKYYQDILSKTTAKLGVGGRDMAQECVNRYGKRYVRLVSDSEERGLITTHNMSEYLDLKIKHFERLGALIW